MRVCCNRFGQIIAIPKMGYAPPRSTLPCGDFFELASCIIHDDCIESLTSASSPSSIVSTDTGTGVATRGVGTESIVSQLWALVVHSLISGGKL